MNRGEMAICNGQRRITSNYTMLRGSDYGEQSFKQGRNRQNVQ